MGSRGSNSSPNSGFNRKIAQNVRRQAQGSRRVKIAENLIGMDIADAVAFMRKQPIEYKILADEKTGEVLMAFKGDRHSVDYPEEATNMKGVIDVHNHPGGFLKEFGGTFSRSDIKSIATKPGIKELRVVTGGKGEATYGFRKTSNANVSGFYRQLSRDSKKNAKIGASNSTFAYRKNYNKVKSSGKSDKAARFAGLQGYAGMLHRYYKDTAEQFGLQYYRFKH